METVPEHVSADESMLKVWNEKKVETAIGVGVCVAETGDWNI